MNFVCKFRSHENGSELTFVYPDSGGLKTLHAKETPEEIRALIRATTLGDRPTNQEFYNG